MNHFIQSIAQATRNRTSMITTERKNNATLGGIKEIADFQLPVYGWKKEVSPKRSRSERTQR
jgi:hypothetical protein